MFSRQVVPQMGLTLLLLVASVAAQQSDVAQEAAMYGLTVPKFLLITAVIKAHGTVMALSFAFLYPMGAIMIRMFAGRSWTLQLHAWWQILAWTLTVAGFGMGLWLVRLQGSWDTPTRHPKIGTVVACIVILMPLLGYLHHVVFTKKGYRNIFTHLHVWIGRLTLVLGGVNGGLGIWFYHDMPFYAIYAYSIVAGVMYLSWFASSLYFHIKGPLPIIRRFATDAEKAEMDYHPGPVMDPSVSKDLANMKEVSVQERSNSNASTSASDDGDVKIVEAGFGADQKEHSKDPNRFPFSNRE